MSCLSADLQTTFLKLGAECLPFSQCTNCGDLRASPRTVIALRTPWKEAFSPQISPCLLQNSKRSPLIGGLGRPLCQPAKPTSVGRVGVAQVTCWRLAQTSRREVCGFMPRPEGSHTSKNSERVAQSLWF